MSNTEHTAPTILSNNYRLPFLQGGFPTYGVMPEVLDQMVHIDASRNILYFEVPKAGCSGIKKYMISMAGGNSEFGTSPQLVHDRRISPLRSPSQYPIDQWFRLMHGEGKRFTFVRNPYARIISAYLDKFFGEEATYHNQLLGFPPDHKMTLKQLLYSLMQIADHHRDIHFMSQDYLTGSGSIKFDLIGQLENFNLYFRLISRKFYFDSTPDMKNLIEFGRHHSTKSSEYILDQEEIDLISCIYANDFKRFGYFLLGPVSN